MNPQQHYKISSEVARSFDLDFACRHYNIYPWISGGSTLLRVLRLPLSGLPYLVEISQSSDGLRVGAFLEDDVFNQEKDDIKEHIAFCLGLDSDYAFLVNASAEDSVLAAALKTNQGIRPKRYGDIFEAVCGAICAQNVDFRRLYQMMELLAKRLGPKFNVERESFWAFPTAEEVANKSLDSIKECKVGYRAQRILDAAKWFSKNASELNINQAYLKMLDSELAIEKICKIPGIGPYSAAIVLSAGCGRQDIFHLDSFTRHILQEFYFDGKSVDDDELRRFVDTKWHGYCGSVAHVLTTNTESWAKHLGRDGFRRSWAKG